MNKQAFVASTSSVEINGWRMNYFDKGPRDATPVLASAWQSILGLHLA